MPGGRLFIETPAEAHVLTRTALRHLQRRGISAHGIVREARREHIADLILTEAQLLGVDWIVLGTHARRALGVALLGSTSLTVARRATRPVILVKYPN
jgi:nucleotide-binding universal stress UspA family protein